MNRDRGCSQSQAEQAFALHLQGTKSCTRGPQHVRWHCYHTAVTSENEGYLDSGTAVENGYNGRRANHVYGLVLAALDSAG